MTEHAERADASSARHPLPQSQPHQWPQGTGQWRWQGPNCVGSSLSSFSCTCQPSPPPMEKASATPHPPLSHYPPPGAVPASGDAMYGRGPCHPMPSAEMPVTTVTPAAQGTSDPGGASSTTGRGTRTTAGRGQGGCELPVLKRNEKLPRHGNQSLVL